MLPTNGLNISTDNNLQITRNKSLNVDINQPIVYGHGWIGIYKESMEYHPISIGGKYMLANPSVNVEIQCSSSISGEDAEDKLQDAEFEVMTALIENKTLLNTVDATMGYNIEYDHVEAETIYFNSAVITLELQVKTS